MNLFWPIFAVAVGLMAVSLNAVAFSLLGPLQNQTNGAADPWQGRPYGGRPAGLGYSLPGDIGGPMVIQESYRWNIPVINYGFDPEFVTYFGQAGVDEVEKAIAIFNALPPASEMNATLEEFPLQTKRQNPTADTWGLLDLKSHTLPLLLEQLGLAPPERFVWCLRSRTVSPGGTNYTVLNLNYDAATWAPSRQVNRVNYNYIVWDALGIRGEEWASAVEWFELDPDLDPYSSVAGSLNSHDFQMGADPSILNYVHLRQGEYFQGLTRDDIGGIRFLLGRDNKRWEALVPGVTGVGAGATNYVNVALRPGVEKLTFQRQDFDSVTGRFRTVTNMFLDIYFTNEVAVTQTLQRVVTTPDILFRVRDIGGTVSRYKYHEQELTDFFPRLYDRSDTSNWVNHAELNDRPGHAGPGVIRPPVHITFNTLGRYAIATGGNYVRSWGSFDASDAPPVIFFGNETNVAPVVETRIVRTNDTAEFEWTILKRWDLRYRIEVTTNLTDWVPFTTIEPLTDWENAFTLRDPIGTSPRFFRSIQEPWMPPE